MLSVLQLCAFSEPFFPNLESLRLEFSSAKLAPLIPLVLSPKTTVIDITFNVSDFPEAIVASMITAFPSLCPNLQDITLHLLPKSPAIIAVVSRMLLASNQNALRRCYVNLPLTEEAREVIFKLPDLRKLSMVIERDALPSPVVLPNLTHLFIGCDHGGGWLRFLRGATFGKLEAACFASGPGQIGDFLEEFERIALAASAQHTLSYFHLDTLCSWNPNYSSLLPFTQLTDLGIGFPCNDGCSSSVDDDTITNLARVMPKLEILHLGGPPCREIPIGVTVKGLAILANHCPHLYDLRVHFQVTSLSAPPAIAGATSGAGFATIQGDCFLTELKVGEIPMAEESVLVVALTLAHIFPLIENIDHVDENWGKVMNAINLSRQIVGYAGKEHTPIHLMTSMTPPQEPHPRMAADREMVRHEDTLTSFDVISPSSAVNAL